MPRRKTRRVLKIVSYSVTYGGKSPIDKELQKLLGDLLPKLQRHDVIYLPDTNSLLKYFEQTLPSEGCIPPLYVSSVAYSFVYGKNGRRGFHANIDLTEDIELNEGA